MKHILAVGNGNQLTEVTPSGVLLVHKWDEHTKSYITHSGDWAGADGVNTKRGIIINTELKPAETTPEHGLAMDMYDDYINSLPVESGW